MDPKFFAPTVILSSYNNTAAHNGSLLALGNLICGIYLLTTRAKTEQFRRVQTSVTYTVQAVVILTLPQCIFYLFIAIVVRQDFPIQIGPCSFIKHFSSYAAQTSYLVPSSIAFCRHLQLVWMFHPDRMHISLFIAFLAVPLMVQFYLLFIQPFGIGLQVYNLYYLRRFIPRPKKENLKNRRASMAPNMVPSKPSTKILSKYIADYYATIGMIAQLLVILIAICLKFSFALILMYTNKTIQSGVVLKIIDLIPYTMPGWVGLISILCISDSRSAFCRFFRFRNFKPVHNQQTTTISLTVASL